MFSIAFTAQGDWKPQDLAKRINDIINGGEDRVTQTSAQRWMLGISNDWWLAIGTNGRCVITNRGGQSREEMEAIATLLRCRVYLLDARVEPI